METILSKNGPLAAQLPQFEPRLSQIAMAKAIAQVIERSDSSAHLLDGQADVLMVEAETGVGKTLAYLLPAILSGQRVVVSTATINLQDQIIKKEIPLLQRTLDEKIPFVCVKGRQNYLCRYRWFQYRSAGQLSLVDDTECERVSAWLEKTKTGDRAELTWLSDRSPLWPKISAQSNQCLGGECPESSLCFINDLRKKAGNARLLVVNHHLFFSDLSLRKDGFGEILPRYQGVVFDEAHHVENVATTFFGKSFSQYQLIDLLGDIERQAESDFSTDEREMFTSAVRGMRKRLEHFSTLFPHQRGRFPLFDLIEQHHDWTAEVETLSRGLCRLYEQLQQKIEYGEVWNSLAKRCIEINNNLVEIALPERNTGTNFVYWYEKRERAISLSAAPIAVAEELQQYLYSAVQWCVFTSATLATAGNFAYIFERLGLPVDTEALQLPSPFDYAGRTLLYVPENRFPMPAQQEYAQEVCRRITQILLLSRGRALVLFTSFKGMDSLAEYLEGRLPYPVLVQGTASRHALLEQFKESTDSVLLAVASFWEGIDVAGESLSCVIVDKLPFEVPSDPVIKARMDAITEQGGKPFFEFQVPRAVLSLRQGVGRLMRSAQDRGLIAIMDVRLFTKGYGRIFRASLPPSPVTREIHTIEEFFKEGQSGVKNG